jgi:Fe-S oxidoreductase
MKAEFLYHRFKGLRPRPRHAYAFGLIDRVARLASLAPEVVNFLGHTPPFAQGLKLAAGMTQQREMPTFAPMTLQRWFRERGGTRNPHGPRVVLFPDTFNNRFHTDVGVAAVEAIEAAGWQVVMPEGHVCCGRPLYDYGFLDLAERYLHGALEVLRDEVRSGTPVVGMEPSCLAVFKDELTGMLPHDDDARRLRDNALHWSEFFERYEVDVPKVARQALLWGHCHHKATGGMDPEVELLRRMGLDVEEASGGCCGLAGSWGFEHGKHEISLACGEQGLLPAVRDAADATVVVANGFSCKTQIEQAGVGRRALHVAQVMKLARERGPEGHTPGRPEDVYVESRPPAPKALKRKRALTLVALAAGVLTVVGGVLARASSSK